jgi:uncharacterized protein (TIGR02246 family)
VDTTTLVERFEIESLRGEFTDALMVRDYDRFSSLFTDDGAWRIPYIGREFVGRDAIRAAVEAMQDLWDYFVQTTHAGTVAVDGDEAVGRAYLCEIGRMRTGRSELNYAIYHDRYRRTDDGWRFAERRYEVRYLDRSPLPGAPPEPDGSGTTT